jgi:hypothetical protein
MPQFARPGFQSFLQRLFPPSGIGIVNPHEVTESVQLTHELYEARFVQGIQLRSNIVTGVAVAADIALAHIEPEPGFIQIPVLWTAAFDTAGTKFIDVAIIDTGNAQDPWGMWEAAGISRTLVTLVAVGSVATGSARLTHVPCRLPMVRGKRYQITFIAVGIGANVRSHFYFLNVPGDLLRPEFWITTVAGAGAAP